MPGHVHRNVCCVCRSGNAINHDQSKFALATHSENHILIISNQCTIRQSLNRNDNEYRRFAACHAMSLTNGECKKWKNKKSEVKKNKNKSINIARQLSASLNRRCVDIDCFDSLLIQWHVHFRFVFIFRFVLCVLSARHRRMSFTLVFLTWALASVFFLVLFGLAWICKIMYDIGKVEWKTLSPFDKTAKNKKWIQIGALEKPNPDFIYEFFIFFRLSAICMFGKRNKTYYLLHWAI